MYRLLLFSLLLYNAYSEPCNADTILNHRIFQNGTLTYNGSELTNVTVLEEGDELKVVCDTGYAMFRGSYQVERITYVATSYNVTSDTFPCEDYASLGGRLELDYKYKCKPKCMILADDSVNLVLKTGTERSLTNGTLLDFTESFNATCVDSGSTIVDSTFDSTAETCGKSGDLWSYPAYPTQFNVVCNKPCTSTQLPANTIYIIGVGRLLKLESCKDNNGKTDIENYHPLGQWYLSYDPMGSGGYYFPLIRNHSTCFENGTLSPASLPLVSQCFANPTLTVTPIADKTVSITVTIDEANRDRGLVLKSITIKDKRSDYRSKSDHVRYTDGTNVPYEMLMKKLVDWEYYDDDFVLGYESYFIVILCYEGFEGYEGQPCETLWRKTKYKMAPPAPRVDYWIVEYSGTTEVTISLGETQRDGIYRRGKPIKWLLNDYGDLTFTIEILSNTTGEVLWITTGNKADTETINLPVDKRTTAVEYRVYKMTVPKGALTKGEECVVRITSLSPYYSKGVKGGSLLLTSVVGKKTSTEGGAGSVVVSMGLVALCLASLLLTN